MLLLSSWHKPTGFGSWKKSIAWQGKMGYSAQMKSSLLFNKPDRCEAFILISTNTIVTCKRPLLWLNILHQLFSSSNSIEIRTLYLKRGISFLGGGERGVGFLQLAMVLVCYNYIKFCRMLSYAISYIRPQSACLGSCWSINSSAYTSRTT